MFTCETCLHWRKIQAAEYEEGACTAPQRDQMRARTGVDKDDKFRTTPASKSNFFTGKNFGCVQYKSK